MPVNFDIDAYLNHFIPCSQLHKLPCPVSRFLGYRSSPQHDCGNVVSWGWALIGGFCGIALIEGVFMSVNIRGLDMPLIIGSFVSEDPVPDGVVIVQVDRVVELAALRRRRIIVDPARKP